MNNKILRLPVVIDKTGLCRSAIYAHIAEGNFPKQINLNSRSVGWLESEINVWIERRIQERDSQNTFTESNSINK